MTTLETRMAIAERPTMGLASKVMTAAAMLAALAMGAVGLSGCGVDDKEYVTTPTAQRKSEEFDPFRKSVIFVIDTSPSMWDKVDGVRKIESAKQSLLNILAMYKEYDDKNHNVEAGLYRIGDAKPVQVVPLEKFNYQKLTEQTNSLVQGNGTPLGWSLADAERDLNEKATGAKYIVMLSDGKNNVGKDPAEIYGMMQNAAKEAGLPATKVYFIAFDVPKSTFKKLEDAGVTLYGAANAKELAQTFEDSTKAILAEEPLPYKTPPKTPDLKTDVKTPEPKEVDK